MGHLGVAEILVGAAIVFGIMLLPKIFFLITLQTTFQQVKPENRKMEPALVWLDLIPVFNLIWNFFIVSYLADSLKTEFAQRNINAGEERPGNGIGMTWCILNCCGIIPFLGFLTVIAGFVCWIIYWVKVADFKSKLHNPAAAPAPTPTI